MLFSLERCLKRYIKDPILLITTSPYEVYAFPCLKDLISEAIGEKGGNHHVVETVLLRPESLITNIWVCLNEELLEWIIDLSCQHPSLDH